VAWIIVGGALMRSAFGNVLIVDDDPNDCEEYRKLLALKFPDLMVEAVREPKDAMKKLKEGKLDVLVNDIVLKGSREAGFESLLEMKNADPGIEVIAFTHAPDPEYAVRCMRAGCLDYLDKGGGTNQLVEGVKRALQLAQSGARRRMLVEQLILADWEIIEKYTDHKKKGRYLENLVALLLGTIQGWSVQERARTSNEEFDLVVRNEINDTFWIQRGSFILVECKNWSGKRQPERAECDAFYRKIQRRSPEYCRLGIFVSLGGVSEGFIKEVKLPSEGGRPVIIVLDRAGVWDLICAPDRAAWLKACVQQGMFG
jgi:DNA-binding NarL/FixJ family response regulator